MSPVIRLILLAIFVLPSAALAEKPRVSWKTSQFKGTPYPPPPFAIRPAYPNLKFKLPTSLEEIPGGRMLVGEIGGKLYTFPANKTNARSADLLLTLSDSQVWHTTVHPNYAKNHQLFVCYSKKGMTYVSRFRVAGSPPVADASSEQVIITWPAGGHNGGCLSFGTDGMLYISTGDGSGPNPPDGRTAAQDVSNLFGCVLRIDVNRKSGGKNYRIPDNNPFVQLKGARPEIWAYGLRNPWKIGIDRKTGRIYAADNGWETWETVHEIVRGGNCGWPIMEGRAILRSEVKRGPTAIRPPIKDHNHTEANSVIGGPIYRGNKIKELQGTFIYGDYITGTIWGIKRNANGSFSHRTLVDTDQRITAFAESKSGDILVVDYDYTGQIYRLVPSGLQDTSSEFPRRLSQTGLFSSVKTMTPASGVVPYDVVVRRWVDGTKAQRWVAIPGNAAIRLADGNSPARYPDGTVFVKHLTKQVGRKQVPVETQLLHHFAGMWHPYTYAWQGEDGWLVDRGGAQRDVSLSKKSTLLWHFNAENECRMCHNAGSGFVLGFVANQLQRSAGHGSQSILQRLAGAQVVAGIPKWNRAARLVDPHDPAQSLNDRARSYLHGNCSSCHHQRGNAIVSFYLRRELSFTDLNTNKGTGIGTFGLQNAKLIVPGDPYRSVLLYRMTKLGYGRMPYIGSKAVDSRGVALIEKWIRSMPHQKSRFDSQLVTKGSPAAAALSKWQKSQAKKSLSSAEAQVLLGNTAGAMAVAIGLHAKTIHGVDATQIYRSKSGDIRGLFEHFVPLKLRRKTLGQNAPPTAILSLQGNSARGRLIFFSDAARCRNCHHATDARKSTGPTLAEIRKKYKRRSEMVTHILKPSLKIDDKFVSWVVITDDGKAISGLLQRQSKKEVALKTAEGKLVVIQRDNIDTMRKSPKSLMPAGVMADLTPQEAADLIEWIRRP